MSSYLCWEPRMESLRLWATSEWNLRKCWAAPGLVCTLQPPTYMLLFPLSYLQKEFTEKMGHPRWNPLRSQAASGWNLHCSHLHAAVFIWLPVDGVGNPGWNPHWNKYCYCCIDWACSTIDFVIVHFIMKYHNFNIIKCHFYQPEQK